jgi:hypothetical protein
MHITDDSNAQFDTVEALYGMSYEYQQHLDELLKRGYEVSDPAVKRLMEMVTEYSQRASYLSLGIFY